MEAAIEATDAVLKQELHDRYAFNIVEFDADKKPLNMTGKDVTRDLEPLTEPLLQAENWGIQHSTATEGILMLDFDKGTCPPGLKSVMTRRRYKMLADGTRQESLHGLVKVKGASQKDCENFVRKNKFTGLEVFASGHALIIAGTYTYKNADQNQTATWNYIDDIAKSKGLVREISVDDFRHAVAKIPRRKKPGRKTTNGLPTQEQVNPEAQVLKGERHEVFVQWACEHVRLNDIASLTNDDLAEILILRARDEGMASVEEFEAGQGREELLNVCRFAIEGYDPKKHYNGDKLDLHQAAAAIMVEIPIVTTPLNNIMFGFFENGYTECKGILEQHIDIKYEGISTPEVNETVNIINRRTRDYSDKKDKTDDIFNRNKTVAVFQNGQLNWLTGEFKDEVSPSLRNTIVYPIKYDPQAVCRQFFKMLNAWTANNSRKKQWIREMIAMSLIQDRVVQKGHFLIGTGSNGKGTLLRILGRMIEGYHTPISLHAMDGKNKHWAESIPGKLAIITPDGGNTVVRDVEYFKSLNGGDKTIKVDPKNYKPYDCNPMTNTIHAFNDPPVFFDNSSGFVRKIQCIVFDQVFEGQRDDLHKLVTESDEELSGILNWVLPIIQRLLQAKPLIRPHTPEETRRILEMKGGDIDDMVNDCLRIKRGQSTLIQDVYAAYLTTYEADRPEGKQTQLSAFSRMIMARLKERRKPDDPMPEKKGRGNRAVWLHVYAVGIDSSTGTLD